MLAAVLEVVVIALSPLRAESDPNVRELLAACTAGLHAGQCALEADATEQPQTRVLVTWTTATEVRIDVEAPHAAANTERTLRFEAADAERERWRTVGFTAALMVGDEQSPAAPDSSAVPVIASWEAERSSDVVERAPSWLDSWALMSFGNGLATAPRTGGALGLGVMPWSSSLTLGASAEYAVTPGENKELAARWLGFTAGPGWRFAPERDLTTTLRLHALLQQREVSGTRGPEVDYASEWVLGARMQLDLVWPARETWAGVVGLGGSVFDGETTILREGKTVARLPSLAASVGVGLRFSL